MKRKRIVAGNWKMNKTLTEVREFVDHVVIDENDNVLHIVGCPFPFLHDFNKRSRERGLDIRVAAQNAHQEKSGAYTGEVSAGMLASIGVEHVILGHSERRQYFHEGGELLRKKVDTALESGLHVIFCCGETLKERQSGNADSVVLGQIREALFHLEEIDWNNMIIAYEPVWAIGTGETASPEQAEEMHALIREALPENIREATPILYGGSVKPANFGELLSQKNIDGGLVGGASLEAGSFSELSRIASKGLK